MSAAGSRQTGSMGEELTNAAMIGLIGLFGLALILRLSGSVAAFVTGGPQPAAGPASAIGVVVHPGRPGTALEAEGLSPVPYWIITALLLGVLVAGGAWVWMRLRRHQHSTETDPRRTPGAATRHEVASTASGKALLKRGNALRPSVESPTPADLGYRLGTSRGQGVWASVEDSILIVGPPRSGKGLHLVIPAILDAPPPRCGGDDLDPTG